MGCGVSNSKSTIPAQVKVEASKPQRNEANATKSNEQEMSGKQNNVAEKPILSPNGEAAKVSDSKPGCTMEELMKEVATFGGYKPSALALNRLTKYLLESQTKRLKDGIPLLFEKHIDAELTQTARSISNLTFTGKLEEWKNGGLVYTKVDDKPGAMNKDKPLGECLDTDRISCYGFAMDAEYIYGMVQPKAMPTKGETYHYRLNLCQGGIVYAIVWVKTGLIIQEWNPATKAYVGTIQLADSVFTNEVLFEAKVSLKQLPKLPSQFFLNVVVWHEFKNLYQSHNDGLLRESYLSRRSKRCLEVLLKYAEEIALSPDDPFPLAQALTEGYIYKVAHDDIKLLVIQDGLKMIAEAERAMSFNFVGQQKLREMNFESILIWANRAIVFGGYSIEWYLSAGKLAREAYRHTVLDPSALEKARRMIQQQALLRDTAAGTVKAIEEWVTGKEKYRRCSLKAIEELYQAYPTVPMFIEAHEGSLADIKNGTEHITTVDGTKIHKGANFSSTFQLDYLYTNGLVYGNCVDIAAIAIAFYKAIGLSSFHITYGVIDSSSWNEYHTFPVYYSSAEDAWFNFNRGENIAKASMMVYYFINRPQIGSDWRMYHEDTMGHSIWRTTRTKSYIVNNAVWTKLNTNGVSMLDLLAAFQ